MHESTPRGEETFEANCFQQIFKTAAQLSVFVLLNKIVSCRHQVNLVSPEP